jgi:hypothetical protein
MTRSREAAWRWRQVRWWIFIIAVGVAFYSSGLWSPWLPEAWRLPAIGGLFLIGCWLSLVLFVQMRNWTKRTWNKRDRNAYTDRRAAILEPPTDP